VNHDSQILITGGGGFIGSALANKLLDEGYKRVICLDNLSTGNWGRLSHIAVRINSDLATIPIEQLQSYLTGTDVIFHLAAVKLHNSKNSFQDVVENNIVGTNKLLEAAGIAGVKTFVFTSSLYAYGLPAVHEMHEDLNLMPTTVYGASKVMGESMVHISAKKFKFNFGIARLFFIYGQNQYAHGGYKSVIVNNFERMKEKKPSVINGDGKQVLDYLHVNDCVNALMLIAKNPCNEVFNVSSNRATSIINLVNQMSLIAGYSEIEYRDPDWTTGTYRVGSNEKIARLLGWRPEVDLVTGLRMTWETLK